ncbi:MAG: hypothetical protein Ta2A_07760 [Treponemataceae bacterium]|nr:MAG: hypothetical protein Ta2A_07760 [Treponemataceae bacterium]
MKSNVPVLILLCVSVSLNALVALNVMRFEQTFSYDNSHSIDDKITSANIVSAPSGAAVIFNPVDITLEKGQRAQVQYSVISSVGQQLNWFAETLYDREIVRVSKNAFGITIEALAPGEALLQTLTADGIKDIARVTVL